MEQPGVVAGNFALSFSLNFLNIFVRVSGSIWPITLIWASLERSFPPAEVEYGWCQFWSKVMTSEGEERPRLVTAGYGRHRSQRVKAPINMATPLIHWHRFLQPVGRDCITVFSRTATCKTCWIEILSSWWSNQAGKMILAVSQFALCPALNETPPLQIGLTEIHCLLTQDSVTGANFMYFSTVVYKAPTNFVALTLAVSK